MHPRKLRFHSQSSRRDDLVSSVSVAEDQVPRERSRAVLDFVSQSGWWPRQALFLLLPFYRGALEAWHRLNGPQDSPGRRSPLIADSAPLPDIVLRDRRSHRCRSRRRRVLGYGRVLSGKAWPLAHCAANPARWPPAHNRIPSAVAANRPSGAARLELHHFAAKCAATYRVRSARRHLLGAIRGIPADALPPAASSVRLALRDRARKSSGDRRGAAPSISLTPPPRPYRGASHLPERRNRRAGSDRRAHTYVREQDRPGRHRYRRRVWLAMRLLWRSLLRLRAREHCCRPF